MVTRYRLPILRMRMPAAPIPGVRHLVGPPPAQAKMEPRWAGRWWRRGLGSPRGPLAGHRLSPCGVSCCSLGGHQCVAGSGARDRGAAVPVPGWRVRGCGCSGVRVGRCCGGSRGPRRGRGVSGARALLAGLLVGVGVGDDERYRYPWLASVIHSVSPSALRSAVASPSMSRSQYGSTPARPCSRPSWAASAGPCSISVALTAILV